MPRNAAELVAFLRTATQTGYRNRLLARGQAQSLVRREGQIQDQSQIFDGYLDQDLKNYGFSLMISALRLLEASRTEGAAVEAEAAEQLEVSRTALLHASYALEAATRNADPSQVDLAYNRLIAGAASHLAGYAARAFSLVDAARNSGRLSPMELTLADLLTRDLGSIEDRILRLRSAPETTDEALSEALGDGVEDSPGATDHFAEAGQESPARDDSIGASADTDGLGPITLLLSEHYTSSIAAALFAIAFGRLEILSTALDDLRLGEAASHDVAAPGPWWIFRLSRHIVSDLDDSSIRRRLPVDPPGDDDAEDVVDDEGRGRKEVRGEEGEPDPLIGRRALTQPSTASGSLWQRLRWTYVASLLARGRAEIDLWPSQLHVVDRIFFGDGDLVVALPTSAGKTRIAELCILRCLAQKRRVVYVTPLRALSAQTEKTLDRAFAPLGFAVSSLYGSMGASDLDGDVLRSSDIVVATPEKLDFAVRANPQLLDDVGLVILDEGHMIGGEQREVRYEAQVQRLLRRADAGRRRLVCLSAVYPDNENLQDFVGWITDDDESGLHKEEWRPTRQQFGVVQWRKSGHARLSVTVGDERPFIPRFVEAQQPTGRRRKNFPNSQNELTIATAWRLVDEGQSVLIFCPLRKSVSALAKLIVKLHGQGFVNSVLPAEGDTADAVAIGSEWFGEDHDIVRCLRLGVAVHHGALPGPFRREVERLLHQRVLKVTVASPTLAQGLDLSASVVLFASLHRYGELMRGAEFANVIGRAGRAFVDTEGLVLYPLFEPTAEKVRNWSRLITGVQTRALESGLVVVARELAKRILAAVGPYRLEAFLTYLTGMADWSLPVVSGEGDADEASAKTAWRADLEKLDVALLSTIGDEGVGPNDAIQGLGDALRDSLWERQLRRLDGDRPVLLRAVIERRLEYVWSTSTPAQRRGWYLAGLGQAAGIELSGESEEIVMLTVSIEAMLADGDVEASADRFIALAEKVFGLPTFAPSTSLRDWQSLLKMWLAGQPLHALDEDQMDVSQFIESDVTYGLVWGMEAARAYEAAQGSPLVELVEGTATAALEAGSLNRSVALLMRSGFDHRSAAIKAVVDTEGRFVDAAGMVAWIGELDPAVSTDPSWPTVASRGAWLSFVERIGSRRQRRWERQVAHLGDVRWDGVPPEQGTWLRVTNGEAGVVLWSPGFVRVGAAEFALNANRKGVLHAICGPRGTAQLRYRGPGDLFIPEASRSW